MRTVRGRLRHASQREASLCASARGVPSVSSHVSNVSIDTKNSVVKLPSGDSPQMKGVSMTTRSLVSRQHQRPCNTASFDKKGDDLRGK